MSSFHCNNFKLQFQTAISASATECGSMLNFHIFLTFILTCVGLVELSKVIQHECEKIGQLSKEKKKYT